MQNDDLKNVRKTSETVWVYAWIVAALFALPFFFAATLGLLGRLADVSARENFVFGLQFLLLAAVPFGIVGIAQACAWFRRN